MKVEEIERRVSEIEKLIGKKDGTAHGLEDNLFLEVLTAIADGAENAAELAKAAIKSAELDIERWFE